MVAGQLIMDSFVPVASENRKGIFMLVDGIKVLSTVDSRTG